MNYDVYSHFPVLAVMCYFVGAFIVTPYREAPRGAQRRRRGSPCSSASRCWPAWCCP